MEKQYRVVLGTYGRREDGEMKVYNVGDTVVLGEAAAERLGSQVVPVEEEAEASAGSDGSEPDDAFSADGDADGTEEETKPRKGRRGR